LEVISGSISAHHKYRLIRGKEVIETGLSAQSLKQNKKNVNQVRQEEECGIVFEKFEDFVSGDVIDAYDTDPKLEGITNTKGVINCF
jgi:translation initiation factor IF-2